MRRVGPADACEPPAVRPPPCLCAGPDVQAVPGWQRKLLSDGLHLTPEGQQELYRLLQALINDQFPSLRWVDVVGVWACMPRGAACWRLSHAADARQRAVRAYGLAWWGRAQAEVASASVSCLTRAAG